MQKTLEKISDKKQSQKIEQNTLELKDIEKFYQPKNKISKYGLEYERLSLDKNTLENASYDKVSKIIEHFAKIMVWDIICDEDTIIGAKSDGSSISLEPGCQMEISLEARESIFNIDLELSKILKLLDNIANIYDVIFLGYGISPKSTADTIELLNKRRYQVMNNYLPYCDFGELCPKMMRQSAGIQINLDYFDEYDAYYKLKFYNLISPFMSGLCANSPLENDNLSSNKTNRAHIWLYTGKARCNMFYENIFHKFFNKEKNIFKNYINAVLKVPMVYIERDNKIIPIDGKINFEQFMTDGFDGYSATYEDYILHQSLCFPDVRLKNYIEIRNHDSQNAEMALALCAFYKGLNLSNIKELLNKFNYLKTDKVEDYYKNVVKYGLDFNITSKIDGWSVIAELFNIAKANLNSKERIYLNPVLNMIKSRKTQADIIIDYDIKNASDLVQFLY